MSSLLGVLLGFVAGSVAGAIGRAFFVRSGAAWVKVSEECIGLSPDRVDALADALRDELMKRSRPA